MTPIAPTRLIAQFVLMVAFVGIPLRLSNWPAYWQIPAGAAVVKLSFSHSADRLGECRRLTPSELAKLPPNMRRPVECPRGRRDIATELVIDERMVFSAELPPSGFARDGPSHIYRRFVVPAGRHTITARLRDTVRASGFDHERTATIDLAPGQSVAIDFRPEQGGFVLR